MTYMTMDPERDADRDATITEPVPVCCECGEEIIGDDIYQIDGDIYCEDCMRTLFRISYEEWERENG